ncbi:POK9 protein, partial [Eurystomus gularis]|nr:POK9 protein [Eurystomus gularis]
TGSARVDVATAVETTLTNSQVQCIPTDIKGLLGHGLSALLLGRSSTTQKGRFVLPGVIDADFTGTISIMVWTPSPPVHVPKGTKIGQLVLFKSMVPTTKNRIRGTGGFGSMGQAEIYLTMDTGKTKPKEQVMLKGPGGNTCVINMLIDTGADVTIIS